MKIDSQYKDTRHHLNCLKLAMPRARIKKKMWFFIKYNNLPKSHMIKERSLGITLKNDFLPVFKEDNNREKSLDMIIKKPVWLSKVFNWLIRLLVI